MTPGDPTRKRRMTLPTTRSIWLACLIASGCVGERAQPGAGSGPVAGDQVAAIAGPKLIASRCDGSAGWTRPSYQEVQGLGVRTLQQCGMVAVAVLADEAVRGFVHEVCAGAAGPGCRRALWRMFLARLQDRYAFADWRRIGTQCRLHPRSCRGWIEIELRAARSHNQAVLRWTSAALTAPHDLVGYERAFAEELDHRRRTGPVGEPLADADDPAPAGDGPAGPGPVATGRVFSGAPPSAKAPQ